MVSRSYHIDSFSIPSSPFISFSLLILPILFFPFPNLSFFLADFHKVTTHFHTITFNRFPSPFTPHLSPTFGIGFFPWLLSPQTFSSHLSLSPHDSMTITSPLPLRFSFVMTSPCRPLLLNKHIYWSVMLTTSVNYRWAVGLISTWVEGGMDTERGLFVKIIILMKNLYKVGGWNCIPRWA